MHRYYTIYDLQFMHQKDEHYEDIDTNIKLYNY